MRSVVLLFLFVLADRSLLAQNRSSLPGYSREQIIANSNFTSHYLYILCRGTTGKVNFIGRDFNLSDTNVTHVGIGFVKNKKFRIFNITNETNGNDTTAFRADSFNSFLQDTDIYYVRIWKMKITKQEFKRADRFVNKTMQHKLAFDFKFKISNGDSLYCSEFCAGMLAFINKRKLSFDIVTKAIDNDLIKVILGREILSYYPVDFFINAPFIRPVMAYTVRN